jgi:transcriptional regulator with XRE-family HTH domain
MRTRTLGEVLRKARVSLGITQCEVGRLTGVKTSHIAYLENGRRRPSLRLLRKLADVLGLGRRDLLFLSHPEVRDLIIGADKPARENPVDSWERFASNVALHRRYEVTAAELRVLSRVKLLGHVSCPSHFMFVLNAIRQASVPPD